ncbi:MAG: hypothetical protein ACE5DO_11280 [Desulfobacterales bacterium]
MKGKTIQPSVGGASCAEQPGAPRNQARGFAAGCRSYQYEGD